MQLAIGILQPTIYVQLDQSSFLLIQGRFRFALNVIQVIGNPAEPNHPSVIGCDRTPTLKTIGIHGR